MKIYSDGIVKYRAMNSRFLVLAALILLAGGTCFAAAFLDITSLSSGVGPAPLGFTGTLGGVGVTGTLTAGPNTSLNAAGAGVGASTTADTSPQWSYPGVYAVTTPLADRVGFSQVAGAAAMMTLTFASPMTDLILQVANLDFSIFDFTPSGGLGLTGMTLLSGNGVTPPADGLGLVAPVIFDKDPTTSDPTAPTSPPPLAGARSAYGSVLLSGTYSTLSFVIAPGGGPLPFEDASFTLVSVPEPGMTTLVAMGASALLLRRRRRFE